MKFCLVELNLPVALYFLLRLKYFTMNRIINAPAAIDSIKTIPRTTLTAIAATFGPPTLPLLKEPARAWK